eukprot:1135522-Prorocentrum_minimum.AAC.5
MRFSDSLTLRGLLPGTPRRGSPRQGLASRFARTGPEIANPAGRRSEAEQRTAGYGQIGSPSLGIP